jgi:hypothetical protein
MSFVHATLVGHFDLRKVGARRRPDILRPLDQCLVARLLAKHGPTIAACVWMEHGYAHCQWAPGPMAVLEFAEELAHEAGAVLVDWNNMTVTGPPQAVRSWEQALAARDEPDAQPGGASDTVADASVGRTAFAQCWRTDTVVALVRQMCESGDFSAMPILADALQDAGCDSAEILDHCRGPGPHVRGCWVVDLVLGKE